jgi:hypothetical protein
LKNKQEAFRQMNILSWQLSDKIERHLILDESGNLGENGRYFVIACLETRDRPALHRSMKNKIEQIKNLFPFLAHKHEIKARKLLVFPTLKEDVLAAITALDVNISYIVVDKSSAGEALAGDKNALYAYLVWRLLNRVIEQRRAGEKINVICDNRSGSAVIGSQIDYAARKNDLDFIIEFKDSSAADAYIVQAADYVANAIYTYYESGYDRFLKCIRHKVGVVEKFPCQKRASQDTNDIHVFADESGEFSIDAKRSPFFLLTLVFHDPADDMEANYISLSEALNRKGYEDIPVHAGPLIYRYDEFRKFSKKERKEIFDIFFAFLCASPIKCHTVTIETKSIEAKSDFKAQITQQLSAFLDENMAAFFPYERLILHYDSFGKGSYGQTVATAFKSVFGKVKTKIVSPADSRLFQAADMLCSLEFLALKMERNMLTKRDVEFFSSASNLDETYLSVVRTKRFGAS